MTKIINLVEEKQMCSLPWVHTYLALHDDSIKPCCHYRGSIGKVSDGLSTEWFNQKATNIRDTWLADQPTPSCGVCDVGPESFSYKKWKNNVYSKNFTFLHDIDVESPQLPSVFHINLNNTCNLSCRMCAPSNSSKIFQIVRKVPELEQYLRQAKPPAKIDIETLRGTFKNAEFVTFTGGEPMLNEDTLTIIKMIEEESTSLRHVGFTTNMTIINDVILAALDSLDASIHISISVDGPPHIQEYVRHGTIWTEMVDNLRYITTKFPRFILSVNTTVSTMTVGYLAETLTIIEWLQRELDIKFDHLMASPVTDKAFLHPAVLPQDIKSEYLAKIKSSTHGEFVPGAGRLLNTAVEMLTATVDCPTQTFVDYINKFDSAVKTNILEIYPEFKSFF